MHYRRIVPALILAACAWAADAPTDAEWAPVAAAMESGSAEAVAKVEAITTQFPKWPDGHRALATARLRAGDAKGAWSAARAALGLNKLDSAAAALGVQALAAQNRHADAIKVAEGFKSDADDVGGEVAAQGAIVALQTGDADRLAAFLASAKARAGANPSPMLAFIEAKQALSRQDLPGANAALERATAARANWRDALYELGRVRTVMALQTPDQAAALLTKAEEAFLTASRLDARDAASRFGLGRARLERGKAMIKAGQADDGKAVIRTALTALDEALALVPNDRDGQVWKGDALLRLERYEESVPFLKYAWQQGVLDRALPFNLSLALSKSGKSQEAAKVLANIEARTPSERLTLGMNAYRLGNWDGAREMLTASLDDLDPTDPVQREQRLAVIRFLGHCERELATGFAEGSTERERHLETAIDRYKMAGNDGDFASRHWYLATQAPRSPLKAFEAGKQSMAWDGFWNPTAWKLLAANYGYKVTRGQGIGGAFEHGLPHVFLWVLLAIIPLGLFAKGVLLPPKPPSRGATGSRASPKPGTASAKPGSAVTRRPGAAAAATRKPGASTVKKPPAAGGPKTPFGG